MEKNYYYRVGEQQIGPVSLDQMRGNVTLDTYVWAEGMATWQQINQLPELQAQLGLVPAYQQPMPAAQPSYQNAYSDNSTQSAVKPPKPDNHLVMAIIAIFTCQILGIIATIMAVMSDSAYNRGDYEEAEKKAKTAKTLALVGLIGGGIIIVAYIIMMVAAAGAGALQTY